MYFHWVDFHVVVRHLHSVTRQSHPSTNQRVDIINWGAVCHIHHPKKIDMIEFKQTQIGYTQTLLSVAIQSLEKGKSYALIGPNGSGKSTFLKSITGQLSLIKGTILLNGIESTTFSALDRSKVIAFVPSRFPEISNMTVFDFIGLGRTPYLNALGRLKESDQTMIGKAIQQLEIEGLTHKFIQELSDGEKQLCAIARAICQETPIIILDEPTSFLDYKNKLIVLNKLNELSSTLGKCILFSSHDLEMVHKSVRDFLVINTKTHLIEHKTNIDLQEIIATSFS